MNIRNPLFLMLWLTVFLPAGAQEQHTWIRINLLGYATGSSKVAVWCSKRNEGIKKFQLVDAATKKVVYTGIVRKSFGAYGPFNQTCRLDFSAFARPGQYYLQAGNIISPGFTIGNDVYKGSADFCLRYMRQQRSGFNPFLKDSCHTHDGYTMYGPMRDSTYIDVSGGWHDASDYLQYSATSANATYHLLMAYRDFPGIFTDEKQANGLDGKNNLPDVLDEAKWGIDWLLKMHPQNDWMFNQVADDRDHRSMRIPGEDSFYGKGAERPVYFITGESQGLFKYKNRTTGTSSTAAKFSSVFSLGYQVFSKNRTDYSLQIWPKALTAMAYSELKPGVTQTAPGRAPYFYEEDNWVDDIELELTAYASVTNDMKAYPWQLIDAAFDNAKKEPVTPWLGSDTAKHYQWYPFINIGHRELAVLLSNQRVREKDAIKYDTMKRQLLDWYKQGIEKVWQKARVNGFYRGIPFIWCSNNLTTSFATQCYWYRTLSGNNTYIQLEQACFDWLFGCNPWGTAMVYGLPSWADTPADPHSAFTHLKNYPIDGGLVDGPVYGSIYKNLIGITLYQPDEYAEFQSDLVVYHDDYGDYSTNEPTMDGTASLIYLLAAKEAEASLAANKAGNFIPVKRTLPAANTTPVVKDQIQGSLTVQSTGGHWGRLRGDTTQKRLSIVFTGDEFGEGAAYIIKTLRQQNVKASFFFTGRFYRNPAFKKVIQQLKAEGHYLGPHSDQHLLYCDWTKRDSLLVTKSQFTSDLQRNYAVMKTFGISKTDASLFIPPYEWYNDTIVKWANDLGVQLINFSPGTKSTADYTTPDMKNYRSSEEIWQSILEYEKNAPSGLNGFILLIHIGSAPERTDKFYLRLPQLVRLLKQKGYQPVKVDELMR